MKKIVYLTLMLFTMAIFSNANADANILVTIDNEEVEFSSAPIIQNGRTLVQLRPIALSMNVEVEYEPAYSMVILSDGATEVRFSVGSDIVLVNDNEVKMEVSMQLKDDYTFIPVRYLAEPFGYEVSYDDKTSTIELKSLGYKDQESNKQESLNNDVSTDNIIEGAESGNYPFTFYYQSQKDLALENNGRGYCWVCSYAMVISDVSGNKVTPIDIAVINQESGHGGSYMSGHASLVGRFGLKLVPALSEDSKYFGGFNTLNRGETTIIANSDEDAYLAIREALEKFPNGVIVRYDGYPHSMVAVEFDDNNIYFNDPGISSGEHVTFENTCLHNFSLKDISSIQAIEK